MDRCTVTISIRSTLWTSDCRSACFRPVASYSLIFLGPGGGLTDRRPGRQDGEEILGRFPAPTFASARWFPFIITIAIETITLRSPCAALPTINNCPVAAGGAQPGGASPAAFGPGGATNPQCDPRRAKGLPQVASLPKWYIRTDNE
jgi:hypothetical protein